MAIYRGVGGSGDASNDASVNQIADLANQAAASAAAALASENAAAADEVLTNQDAIDTAADLVLTNADVVLTHADVVLTAADAASTAADVLLTNADVVTTNANAATTTQDAIDTAADAAATAADLVQTNLDQIATTADAASTAADALATAADKVATNADVVLTHADVVLTNADAAATALALDEFTDTYLGAKASAPTLDNDGNALIDGALYFDTTTNALKVYDLGNTVWLVIANYIHPDHTGDVTSTGDGATVIANDAVTYAKLQNISATARVLGRNTAGAGDAEEITEAQFKTLFNLESGIDFEPADATILKDADIGVTVLAPSGDGSGLTGISKGLPARNAALNQDPVSQGTSTRTGMSSTIYTGNGTSQSVATGVDMATGDLGGLVWVKNRDAADGHVLSDSIRGVTKQLASDATAAETTDTDRVTSFDTNGFGIGADVKVNTNLEDYVAWSFQTNKKTTGTTNRNKAYTAHYNSDMGFSIVGYVGDGVDGHEIPHHLGVEPELSIFKNRDAANGWAVYSPLFPGQNLNLELTSALASPAKFATFSPNTVTIPAYAVTNTSTNNYISYHFASVPGVSKVGKYIGTGKVGNYVDCGFKPAFVMVKNLTSAGDWVIWDGIRSTTDVFDDYILPNSSAAETTNSASVFLNIADDGFAVGASSGSTNTLNDEYLFLAFAETSTDATKAWADYSYPTTADTLSIAQNTLMSFANGFNATGQLDTQENVGAGVTYALGVGHENKHYWLYKIKAGAYGVSEYRPLEGITRNDADKWGEVSPLDATLRTTAKHFDYESSTGVALASGENPSGAGYFAWKAFTKNDGYISADLNSWIVDSATTSWLQYKFNEKRILKSWRIASEADATRDPKRFTIEGSNDGLNWTAIDSTYTASDYTGNGSELWGNLQDTSANTTAYLYHRINITANNGHVSLTHIRELELNTILPSDYYLVEEGVMYNSVGTPIERVYLAELMTDSDGDVSWFRNLATAKQKFSEVEIQEGLTVHGEIKNTGVATAWVNFDGTQNPPLIRSSYNVKDVVDTGTGTYDVVFETPMATKYSYSLACVGGSLNVSATSSGLTGVGVVTKTSSTGVNTDTSEVMVQVFGGKD